MSKHNLVRLATKIINTPLMINQSKLDAIIGGPGQLGERFGLEMSEENLQSLDMKSSRRSEERQITGNEMIVAIISVEGVLVQRAGQVDADSSRIRSYQAIQNDFEEALSDTGIDAIIFDIDSPGGEVSGVFDLVDKIYNSRHIKPIYAIANESAFSAAYAIASAAEKIFIPRTANVGSIGVVMLHTDQSVFDSKIGVKYTHIFAGARKVDFTPHEPLSDEAGKVAQASVDSVYDIFTSTVARNRGIPVEEVKKTEAGFFPGSEAVEKGLADEVKSFDEALLSIAQNKETEGGLEMKSFTERMQVTLKGVASDEIATAMAALMPDYVLKSSIPTAVNEADVHAKAKKEAMDYTVGVMDLCNLAEKPGAALGFIKEGTSLEAVGRALISGRAKAGDNVEIDNSVNPMNTGQADALIASAAQRSKDFAAGRGKFDV